TADGKCDRIAARPRPLPPPDGRRRFLGPPARTPRRRRAEQKWHISFCLHQKPFRPHHSPVSKRSRNCATSRPSTSAWCTSTATGIKIRRPSFLHLPKTIRGIESAPVSALVKAVK